MPNVELVEANNGEDTLDHQHTESKNFTMNDTTDLDF